MINGCYTLFPSLFALSGRFHVILCQVFVNLTVANSLDESQELEVVFLHFLHQISLFSSSFHHIKEHNLNKRVSPQKSVHLCVDFYAKPKKESQICA